MLSVSGTRQKKDRIFLKIMRLIFSSIFLLVIASNGILASGVDDKKYVSNICEDNLKKIKESIEVNERRSSSVDNNIQDGLEVLRVDIASLTDQTSTCSNREDIKTIKNELYEVKEKCREQSLDVIKHISSTLEEINSSIKELKALIIVEKNSSNDFLSGNSNLKNCADVSRQDNVTTVYPYEENSSKPVVVLCDQTTDGGGWTVIQNRDALPVRENFERGWNDYVEPFGDLNGEFWLGLDNIYALTKATPMELRVDLEDYDGVKKWAKYDLFRVGDESEKYVLTLGKYSGDAGDSLTYHNGMKFSTYDQDNDEYPTANCAKEYRGAWWFNNCRQSNLNGYQHVGKYDSSKDDGIHWFTFHSWNYSYKKASMKIRPKFYN